MSAANAYKLDTAVPHPFSKPRPPRTTEEEYEAILADSPDKLEFLDGKIVMMAGGGYSHSHLKTNTTRELGNAFRKRRCHVLDSDMKVKIVKTGLNTFPDASVVCGAPQFKDEKQLTLLNPGLLVEVLSASTESYDRGTKFWHYRQIPSLNTYVLISTTAVRIEVFELDDDEGWHLTTFDGPEAVMKLRHYEVEIPLAAIYEMTPLDPAEAPAREDDE